MNKPQRQPGLSDAAIRARVLQVAATVLSPEYPGLSLTDLGVLREVTVENGKIAIVFTPTHPGTAANLMSMTLEVAIEDAGLGLAKVVIQHAPPWSPDWMSEEARAKLARIRTRRASRG